MRGEVDAEEDEEALQVGIFILDNLDNLSMGQAVQVVQVATFQNIVYRLHPGRRGAEKLAKYRIKSDGRAEHHPQG